MGKRKRDASSKSNVPWIEDHLAAASLAYKKENISDMNEKVKLAGGWEFYKTLKGPHGTQAKIWISPTNGNVLVAFRGTSSMAELKLDISVGAEPFYTAKQEQAGHVYRGFDTEWKDFKKTLETEFRVLKDTSYLPDGSNLEFCGHSSGGAVSEIAATYFADVYPTLKITETSVGGPASGDKTFGEYSRSRPNLERIRIVTKGDPIANTKLPGMEFVEQENVIQLVREKKSKGVVIETLKGLGRLMFPITTLVAEQIDESYQNHMLENYANALIQEYEDQRVESVPTVEPLPPQDLSLPVNDGSCQCECHVYDLAKAKGKIPPETTATVEPPAPTQLPASTLNLTTKDPMLVKQEDGMLEDTPPSKVQADIQRAQDDQLEITEEQEPSVLMQMIEEGLTAAAEKEQENVDKLQEKANQLQEQYASLTNQADESLDPVVLDRQRYEKTLQDLNFFDSRIQLELEHPEYVPNDKDGGTVSRDKAVALKNQLNRVYSMIQSARSKQYANTLEKDFQAPEEAEINKMMVDDQANQMRETLKDNQLTPDQQPAGFIFDIDLLGDLNSKEPSPEALAQIQKWLEYSNMSPRELYGTLEEIMTSKYKNDRLKSLREEDQSLRQQSAENIKVQITELQKEAGTTDKTLDFQKRRRAFFTTLAGNQDVQKMVEEKSLDINKVIQSYTEDSNEAEIMQKLLGYDPAQWQQDLQQSYFSQLDEMARGTDPKNYANALYETQGLFEQNKKYPWLTMDKFRELTATNDPEELDKAAMALRPSFPSEWQVQPIAGEDNIEVDKTLLEQKVEALPDATGQIQNVEFKDYYQAAREKLESQYNDPQLLALLFKQWNPDQDETADGLKNFIDAITTLPGTTRSVNAWQQLMSDTPTSGWFDKKGNFLGASASPDFAEYAKAHPELGVHYVTPTRTGFTEFMDAVEGGVGQTVQMYYGVDPVEVRDTVEGAAGMDTRRNTNETGVLGTETTTGTNPGNAISGMGSYAMMRYLARPNVAPAGETPPRASMGYVPRERTPLRRTQTTGPSRGGGTTTWRSQTSRLSTH